MILEEHQRLSQSLIWQLQRDFYEKHGISAWSEGHVPHYITNNPYFARAYARLVVAFAQDWAAAISSARAGAPQPVMPIVELGSGAGRFAYLFLTAFLEEMSAARMDPTLFRYVMTDLPAANIHYWQKHPGLRAFVEQGLLDFAQFDAVHDTTIRLVQSQIELAPDPAGAPLVLLANYYFDSVPSDLFRVRSGHLYECLVTTTVPDGISTADNPDLIQHLELTYAEAAVTFPYYEEDRWNKILTAYMQQLADTTLRIPTAALSSLQFFEQLAAGRLLILSSDRGYIRASSLDGRGSDEMGFHGGSFSLPVNYHAVGAYVDAGGGRVWHAEHEPFRIVTAAFAFGLPPDGYGTVDQTFRRAIVEFGPDDFYAIVKATEPHYNILSLEQILALLRLSCWDPKIMIGCQPRILTLLPKATAGQRQDLIGATTAVWRNYYHMDEESDLPYALGAILYEMAEFDLALGYLEVSHRHYPANPHLSYAIAVCHLELDHPAQALMYLEETLALFPNHGSAKSLLSSLRKIQ